jgi:predicted ATPase
MGNVGILFVRDRSCRLRNDVYVSVPTTTGVIVLFRIEEWDTDNMANLATDPYRIYFRTPGHYIIGAGGSWLELQPGDRAIAIVDDEEIGYSIDVRRMPESLKCDQSISTIIYPPVNSSIRLKVWQNSGITQRFVARAYHSITMWATRIR